MCPISGQPLAPMKLSRMVMQGHCLAAPVQHTAMRRGVGLGFAYLENVKVAYCCDSLCYLSKASRLWESMRNVCCEEFVVMFGNCRCNVDVNNTRRLELRSLQYIRV